MPIKLTVRQQQVLDLIQAAIAESGFPPTRAEIATALGFKSANAAEDHLRALARKGAIELMPGTSRGIRLTNKAVTSTTPKKSKPASPLPIQQLKSLLLPIVGRVAAGNPILAQQHLEGEVSIESGLFASKPDYLLRVRGNSMCNIGILNGDLLAVKKSPEAHNGQVVVARLGDEVTVKRFSRSANGSISLLPENADYDPIVVQNTDEFAIEGLAVGLIRTGSL